MKSDLFVNIAHSIELDSMSAVNEVIIKCEKELAGRNPSAGILYVSIDHNHPLILDQIHAKWPDLHLIGCTTDGEFSSENGYVEDSMVLTLFTSNSIEFSSGFINNQVIDMENECRNKIFDSINQMTKEPSLCLLFSDVINTNGESVMEHVSAITSGNLPIVGGISADSWRFNQTKQFYKTISSDHISPYLLMSGDFVFSIGMDCGWEAIGEMGTVTKSKGNIVYEIDHMPTLKFYQHILGNHSKPTLELPLAVYDHNGNFSYMRTSFEKYNDEDGSVTFLGNIPQESKVRITMVNRDSILNGTRSSINQSANNFPLETSPLIALCFSCSARRVLLGTRTKEEARLLREILGDEVKFVGFYTYGEFCPNLIESENEFHNETFVVVLLG